VVSGEGTVEQWVYAGPDSSFVTQFQEADQGQSPAPDLLKSMFTTQDNQGLNAPLFNLLQFPLEAYQNTASNTISVTHVFESKSGLHSNLICVPSGRGSP
jgi:hypothetical protein